MLKRSLFALLTLSACVGGGGDDTQDAETRWYLDCGSPACAGYQGPYIDIPLCSDISAREGRRCGEDTVSLCDPVDDCGALMRCAASDPRDGECPISLARFKEDIRYVDAAQRRALAEQALGMRLARWRYIGVGEGVRPSAGFLIDDLPDGSPAVAPDGGHVDLYGYTSMVLAAAQQQQVELEQTRAELASTQLQLEALEARLQALEGR